MANISTSTIVHFTTHVRFDILSLFNASLLC